MGAVNGPANIHTMHGMIYIIFILFLVVVVEVAVITNYMTLCMEIAEWWWRIWWGASMIGFYTFVIMLFYMLYDLRVEYFTTLISYAAASALVSSMIALMASALAMVCTFKFNLGIYSRVKLDD